MTTQHPEALRLAEELDDGYPLTGDAISAAAELRSQHARITELEAQLSAIGAGGVSPLRNAAQETEATHLRELAAPSTDQVEEILRERDDADDFIDALLDEVLGPERPEWSSAYGRADALNDVRERMTALHKPAVDKAWDRFQSAMEAPQQPAPSPVPSQPIGYLNPKVIGPDGKIDAPGALTYSSRPCGGWTFPIYAAAPTALTAQEDTQPAPVLPESLTLAVDRWFSENTGLGGCSDKDVSELGELFYGVKHAGGRESVEDALAIVESFGQGIGGLNDTYARQILLAEEVKRLREARTPENSQPAPVLDEAFDCARAALNHCLDRASIAHILDTLRTRMDKAVLAAARATADSVTAPAVTVIKTGAIRQWMSERLGHLPDGIYSLYLAPPTQAADSVLEDAARLDWLDQQCEGYGFQEIHEGNRWEISGPYANVRQAIDYERAARKQGEKQ